MKFLVDIDPGAADWPSEEWVERTLEKALHTSWTGLQPQVQAKALK